MRDDGTKIIDDLIRVCKEVHPLLNNSGSIIGSYQRDSFEDLYETIGDLYHTLVCFNIPTKYLSIEITDTHVKIKLDYRCLKILCPDYWEEEEEK